MKRFRPSVAFFVLSLLVVGGTALAGNFKTMAQKLILGDDATAKFGASTDLTIGWETAGDHDRGDIVTATGVLVREDADVDLTWAAPTAGSYIGACSDDAAAPTECVHLSHNSTKGVLRVESGALEIQPIADANDGQTWIDGNRRKQDVYIDNSNAAGARSTVILSQGGTGGAGIWLDSAGDELRILVDDDLANNALVLTEWDYRDQVHDHAAQDHPTLFLQAGISPNADNTQWGSLAHNGTDLVIGTGKGDLKLAAGVHLKRYESCTCNYNSGTVACATGLAADDLVTDCYMKVSTVWDGNGYAKCRTDTGESDVEVASFSNSKLQALGWTKSAMGNKLEGAGETYPLTGSDDSVDCVATPGTSGQGAGVMYVVIESFQ